MVVKCMAVNRPQCQHKLVFFSDSTKIPQKLGLRFCTNWAVYLKIRAMKCVENRSIAQSIMCQVSSNFDTLFLNILQNLSRT